jgi:hypothetical protein
MLRFLTFAITVKDRSLWSWKVAKIRTKRPASLRPDRVRRLDGISQLLTTDAPAAVLSDISGMTVSKREFRRLSLALLLGLLPCGGVRIGGFSLPTAATTRWRFRRCPQRLCRCPVSAGADPVQRTYLATGGAVSTGRPITRRQSPRKVGNHFERRPSLRRCAMFELGFVCSDDRTRRPSASQGSTCKVPPRHRISFEAPTCPNTPWHHVRDRFNGLTSPREVVCRIAHDLTPNEWIRIIA